MAKAEEAKKIEMLRYRRIAVNIFYTDGEENLAEFISAGHMFYYLKKLFFEKPSYVDTVRIELF